MNADDFQKYLVGTGHVYSDMPDGVTDLSYLRHIGDRINDRGETSPLCENVARPLTDKERAIYSPPLFRDANCPDCLRIVELPEHSLTKRHVMLNCVHLLINIEQQFLDALYWNQVVRAEGEEPINPDPEGELAAAWEQFADQIIMMAERCRPAMASHASRFGWPLDFEGDEE